MEQNSDPEPPVVDLDNSVSETKKSDGQVEETIQTEAMPIVPALPPKENNHLIEQSVIEQTDTHSPRMLKSMQLQPLPETTLAEQCR